MNCPFCDYVLADYEDAAHCPKCKGKGLPKPAPVAAPQIPASPYNPTIPRPVPPVVRKSISPFTIAALLLVPVVAGAGILHFSGMELRPKEQAPIATPTATVTPQIVVAPTIAPPSSPTATRPKSALASRPTTPPQKSATPTLTPRGFGVFADETLEAIRSASTPQKVARIGLDLMAMSYEADQEKKRSAVRRDGKELMWNYAAGMFSELADFASARAQYLDGTMFESEYKARNGAIGQVCGSLARLADMRLPKTDSEKQGVDVLNQLKNSMGDINQ